MSGSFDVLQNGHRVASFQSDTLGHFTVKLAPGTYVIVASSDAPVMNKQSQPVTVGADGLTTVQLTFDTGIR